jgi:FtsZ-interacting cell division protein ZipA
MSTEAIIVIAAAAIVIIVLTAFTLSRTRNRSGRERAEKELYARRERAVSQSREEAQAHERRAEKAQGEARRAEHVAEREHAEAEIAHERAERHAAARADEDLVGDHERDRFADVTGLEERTGRFSRETQAAPGERAEAERPPRR